MTASTEALTRALTALDATADITRWTTPIGVARHRAAIREAIMQSDETYLASFSYPDPGPGLDTAKLALAEAESELRRLGPHPAASLVEGHLALMTGWFAAIASRRDDAYTLASIAVHGLPTPEIVATAGEQLTHPAPDANDSSDPIDTPAFVAQLTRALTAYGLSHWTITLRETMAARVSVNGSEHRISLRADYQFQRHEVTRLVLHEVGTHVLRRANAEAQPEGMAAHALGDTVPTEEGLAAWLEDWGGCHDENLRRTYAARVVAVDRAQHGGILEVARELAPYVGITQAAEIALRVKRGLRDPNHPGGLTKDHGYLTGLQLISKVVHDRSNVPLLFATKWPVASLPAVRELVADGRLVMPALVPDLERLGLAKDLGSRRLWD